MAERIVRLAAALVLGFAACAAAAQTVTRSFGSLRAQSGPELGARALVVELSARELLAGVHLHIATAAAPPSGSRYVVWVNGQRAGGSPAVGTAQTIALSLQPFAPGINSIQLALVSAAAQGDAAAAGVPSLDDTRSSVTLDFAGLRPNPAPTLAQLPIAFDRHAWLARSLTIAVAGASRSPVPLSAAAAAVEAVALRMPQVSLGIDYRPLADGGERHADAASWDLPPEFTRDGDLLLVGRRDALASVVPEAVARAVIGPFLGIYPASGGKSMIVVVSGLTDDDCLRAARAFADTSLVLPAASSAVVGDGGPTRPAVPAPLDVSLASSHRALAQAVLAFAAIDAQLTGQLTGYRIAYDGGRTTTRLLFGAEADVASRMLRRLPVYPPLHPGEVVSLRADAGARTAVAFVGSNEASVARAVAMLRAPNVRALFARESLLFDTRDDVAKPLAVVRRSLAASIRLFLADPLVFWSALAILLLLSCLLVNATLKRQVAARLAAGDPYPSPERAGTTDT